MKNISPKMDFPSEPLILDDSLILQIEEFWFHVFVTTNCTDIRGIVMDDDSIDQILKLSSEMKDYYNTEESEVLSIVEGRYYAVFDDVWHRVQCTNYDSHKQEATVLFIDRGDEDSFSADSLHFLPSKFCDLPMQSFKLSLNDLDVFKYCEEIQDLLDDLLNERDVYVRNLKLQEDENNAKRISAELILDKDTENESNVNEILLKKIFQNVVDPTFFLDIDKVAMLGHISFISEQKIFIQAKSKGLVYLNTLMNSLTNSYLNNSNYVHHLETKFDITKMYVTKSPKDNNWYRVKIIEIKNENEALIIFVDIGNTLTVNLKSLISLSNLSKLLVNYPEQAVEVKLHKISSFLFDENMRNRLSKLTMAANTILYIKVVGNYNGTPVVQICIRTDNNYLISVNDALVSEPPTM